MLHLGRRKLIKLYYEKDKTLQEIGNKYGVTRERVRQKMEEYDLPRRKPIVGGSRPVFSSVEDYFSAVQAGQGERLFILRSFFPKGVCQECKGMKNLHIHHKRYPARSPRDIQILCASCHHGLHRKGNGNRQQKKICKEYLAGLSGIQLGKKYNVSSGMIYHILKKWQIKTRPSFEKARQKAFI